MLARTGQRVGFPLVTSHRITFPSLSLSLSLSCHVFPFSFPFSPLQRLGKEKGRKDNYNEEPRRHERHSGFDDRTKEKEMLVIEKEHSSLSHSPLQNQEMAREGV